MECPDTIGGAKVVCFTRLAVESESRVSGLAICQHTGGQTFYLFGCDSAWRSISDTWHQSLTEAKKQAEFEHAGVSASWQSKP
jgi:hypothetical protein